MSAIDAQIDEVYKAPLSEFVAQRDALASSLNGTERKRVKALTKPTVVPWAVNQTYWHARQVYDRLLASGKQLRAAQIASLQGRTADVREASAGHRAAIAKAIDTAMRLAAAEGAQPARDALQHMFEAVSLADPAEPHGRFTKPLKPAGFEALSGIAIAASGLPRADPASGRTEESPRSARASRAGKEARQEQKQREHDARLAEKRRQAELRKAEAAVDRAATLEKEKRREWERAKAELESAQETLRGLQEAAD